MDAADVGERESRDCATVSRRTSGIRVRVGSGLRSQPSARRLGERGSAAPWRASGELGIRVMVGSGERSRRGGEATRLSADCGAGEATG